MSSNKLLVASMFGLCNRNKDWIKLQCSFLKETTENYDHAVYLDRIDRSDFPESIHIIGTQNTEVNNSNASKTHCDGLNKIVSYAKEKNYESLLVLDSDCFPIAKNWLPDLVKKMKNQEVAAVVRYENLDTFPHPSVHFFRSFTSIQKATFGVMPYKNIIGVEFADSTSNIKNFYPLIRTNKTNPHPIMYGIYANMFYHHAAGTRSTKSFRGGTYYSYPRIVENETTMFKYLMEKPNGFLQKLQEAQGFDFAKMEF